MNITVAVVYYDWFDDDDYLELDVHWTKAVRMWFHSSWLDRWYEEIRL